MSGMRGTAHCHWDPRVLLPAFFAVNTALLSAKGAGLLFFVPLLIAAPFVRAPEWIGSGRRLFVGSATLLFLALLIIMGHGFEIAYSPRLEVVYDSEGMISGLLAVGRLALLYSAAVVFTAVCPGHETAGALHWYLGRVSPRAADRIYAAVLLVFRFVPRLWELASDTLTAVRMRQCRGIGRVRSFAGAFVYRVVREADAVATAAEARGYFGAVPAPEFRRTTEAGVVLCVCTLYSLGAVLFDRGLL